MPKKEKTFEKKEELSAPFNAAVACLMRIDDCLKRFYDTSKSDDPCDMLVLKRRIAKEIIIQSSPLLKAEKVNELMKEIRGIKVGIDTRGFAVFSSDVADKIDDVVIKVQSYLQDAGNYLMPSLKDPRFTWGQG